MNEATLERWAYLCATIPHLLMAIEEQEFAARTAPGKWSKKEIIGHLVDSAANNHQRFVRAQFEDEPNIGYDQNKWNECNFYQLIDGHQIIALWTVYNRQLIELVRHIPPAQLQRRCRVGDELHALDFLIDDYMAHMEHHLREVVNY